MKEEVIIAGFGGQGVMLAGKLLAFAAMKEGFEVSWMPSYGPEMRGGTANCTVIISSERIPSPFSSRPDTILVMNNPSKDKFLPLLKSGGLVILNSSLIKDEVNRSDVKVSHAAANEDAEKLGNKRAANMIILGSYLAEKNIVDIDLVKNSLHNVLPEHRQGLIPVNKLALEKAGKVVNREKAVI